MFYGRPYNEDRVTALINFDPLKCSAKCIPKCSFFAVYDGHGGEGCANYLRDNLHQFVMNDSSFPHNPREALKNGIELAEKTFLELCQSRGDELVDHSGSCAVVVLVVEDTCYIANIGDCRAVLSLYL